VPVAIGAAVLASLAVAAVRIDLIRVRYGLAEALEQEQALLQARREGLARLRTLRDPADLGAVARENGFVRPARIVDLPVAPPAPAARRP